MSSAKDGLHDDLKRQILTMEFDPDEDLNEVGLGELYGLSRTPVRDIVKLAIILECSRFKNFRQLFCNNNNWVAPSSELSDLFNEPLGKAACVQDIFDHDDAPSHFTEEQIIGILKEQEAGNRRNFI